MYAVGYQPRSILQQSCLTLARRIAKQLTPVGYDKVSAYRDSASCDLWRWLFTAIHHDTELLAYVVYGWMNRKVGLTEACPGTLVACVVPT